MIASPDHPAQPARVLIVDDERQNRYLLEVSLAAEGYQVQTAVSGEEALAIIARQAPDLILLDIMMPGMDGYQVLDKIKGDAATKNIPTIMVSAMGERNAKMLGLTAGAEDYITKPVDRAELCVRVRNLLRLKAYADYHDKYSQLLETEVVARTADLLVLTERLTLATAVANMGVWEWDLASNTLTWDATMFEMYGREPIVGMPYAQWSAAVWPEDLPGVEATLQRAIAEKGQGSAEYRITLPDGAVRTMSTLGRAILDEHGNVSRFIGVEMDITERKRADGALEQSRRDQMRFKDEFLSHVSQELGTPLTAIKQFATSLLGGLAGGLTKVQNEYLETILTNIRQLQAMIDDLLEVTRLETGKLTVDAEAVAPAAVVADAFDLVRESARANGVTLSSAIGADVPRAHADPARLRQILSILLDNAIRFTPDGGAITLSARLSPDDSRLLLFDVSDTGSGLSPEISDRIFERIYQVSERQASRKGLGLSLFICKELVTRQGGAIWARRRPEGGTIVSFTLPVYSLDTAIAPLLRNDAWPAPSVAVVMVETGVLHTWPSKESHEAWSREARSVVRRCLVPARDVLLPTATSATHGDRFFVATFADDAGAAALASEIRGQFERLLQINHTGLTALVSYRMLRPSPRGAGASMASVVTGMSAQLEGSMGSHVVLAA